MTADDLAFGREDQIGCGMNFLPNNEEGARVLQTGHNGAIMRQSG